MLFLKIILYAIICITKKSRTACYAEEQLIHTGIPDAIPYNPKIEPSLANCNVSTTQSKKIPNYGLRLHLPFMDIEIQNERIMRILQEPQKQLLFVLHGNELFQMFVSREEKRLSLIARLDGSVQDMEHVGADIILWHEHFLLVVALEEYIEVYQFAESTVVERAKIAKDPKRSIEEEAPHFEPIQELTLPGKYRKIFLTEASADRIMLIMAVSFNKLHGQIKTFEWINTYFDPIEEITLPPLHILSLIGDSPKYLMTGRSKGKSRTIFTIYEIEATSMHLKKRQTFAAETRTPQMLTYHGKNYIFACSKATQKCNIFKMSDDGHFTIYRQRSSKEFSFTQVKAAKHFLVGVRQNEVLVFPNIRLDCYTAFRTNETDISSIVSHVNEHGEDFILLNYVRPFNTLVRVIEVDSDTGEVLGKIPTYGNDAEEVTQQNQGQHQFENTLGNLRSMLLKRKQAMDVFRKISSVFTPKLKSLKLEHSVAIKTGNIDVIKILDSDLCSPMQLHQRINDLRKHLGGGRVKRDWSALQRNATASMRSHLRVKQLKVRNLLYKHDVIEGFHLDTSAQPLSTLTIQPKITARIVNTPELLTHQNLRYPRHKPSLGLFDFNTRHTPHIREITVKTINDVEWTDFYDSVFLKNRDKSIEGRLVLQSMASVQNLCTTTLNNLIVDKLFNLVQPQVVHSDFLIAAFYTTDLHADSVNGLDFAKDIAFSGVDNVITTPVEMKELTINGDLEIAYDSKLSRSTDEEDENLQQSYTGKLVINGSLTLNNLWKEDDAQVKVEGLPFNTEELKQKFLLKNTAQIFPFPVTFGNARVDAPSLQTRFLNDNPTEEHLLRTTTGATTIAQKSTPLLLIFMSAHIKGQLNCSSYNTRLMDLSQNAVRHGEVANITGIKHFKAPLTVEHLMSLELNQLPASDLVTKSELANKLTLQGNKTFEKITVTDDANIEDELYANSLNSLPLNELLNYDYHLENLTLPHRLYATNVVFHQINGISFDKVFTNFKIRNNKLVLHKDLIVEGNAKFGELLEVELINNIDWNAYQQSLVRQHDDAHVNGTKTFLREVVISKELNVPLWNDVKIEDIFENILRKSKPQTISGTYSFDELSATNVDVGVVNNVSVASFIDRSTPETVIEGDVVVPRIVVHGDIQGSEDCQMDLLKLVQQIKDLPSKPWRNVHVLGDATWSRGVEKESTQDLQLAYLYKNAVTTQGNHTITGSVKLRRPLISQMQTKAKFPSGIDFAHIAQDALLRNTPRAQIISGEKRFARPVVMQNITAHSDVHAEQLNNIDILHFNATLYRLSTHEPIMGHLRFLRAPIVGHLAVEGTLNGLQTRQIYHQPNDTLPPLRIKRLAIDSALQLQDINDMSLDYLLRNRITKRGEALEVFGHLTFENLILEKEILMRSINGIPIDSFVLKESPNLQMITGPKIIESDLVLAGPAHVMRLNEKDLIESYQQSIFTNLDYTFDNLTIEEATLERGLKLSREMSAPSLGDPGSAEQRAELANDSNYITRALKFSDNQISQNISSETNLLYLDYDLGMQFVWQRPAANISIDKSYSYIKKRLTICEREILHVEISSAQQKTFIYNTTTSVITAKLNDISIKVENYCTKKHRKIRSRLTLKSSNYRRTFGMRKFIENVQLFTSASNNTYLLLHVVKLADQANEVRLLRLNNANDDVNDVQSLTSGIGSVMCLFAYPPERTILVSAGVVKNYPAVSIYTFSPEKQQFTLTQVIDGDYDIIEMQQVDGQRFQLLLSCVGCQRLTIYEYDDSVAIYRIYQFIHLHQHIDRLLSFNLAVDGSRYLMLLSEHEEDFYHLYKWSNQLGWMHFTYGYFQGIQHALPLVPSGSRAQHLTVKDDDMLLLLCSTERCGMVRTVVQ